MHREAGFRRISAVTAWVAAGSLAALGALAALVGHEIPGRSATGTSSSTSAHNGTSPTSRSSGDHGLRSPSYAPSPGFGAGSTTSGAS